MVDASGTPPAPSAGPLYLAGPKQAVAVLRALLDERDWETLVRYYDLSGTPLDADRTQLADGSFFLQDDDAPRHPGAGFDIRHPFPPQLSYADHHVQGDEAIVRVHDTWEEGDGMEREVWAAFRLRRYPQGWQVRPEPVGPFELPEADTAREGGADGAARPVPEAELPTAGPHHGRALAAQSAVPSSSPGEHERVLACVRACLANLAGGSRHLASYVVEPETFRIVGRDELAGGRTAYRFVVQAWLTTEFDVAEDGPGSDDTADELTGRIVLRADGLIDVDGDGRVRIEPFTCLDPANWSGPGRRLVASA